MKIWFVLMVLAGFESRGFGQDNGGIAAGMVANAKHQFDLEVDWFDRIATTDSPKRFDLLKYTISASFWQAKEKGQDFALEAGYCRGFQWHGCVGLGIRKQNAEVTCLQSTLEFGTGFLFSVFARPLIKVQESDQVRSINRRSDFEAEFGVKFKWPIWTY